MPQKITTKEVYDFGKAFGALTQKVDDGFSQVNRRLDTLNGKVAEHERRLNTDDIHDAREDGESKGMSRAWVLVGAILGIAIGIITAYATFLHK